MPHPSNVSFPRSDYYRRYYEKNKHIYRINYEEKKERQEIFKEIYRPFGGERQYYKNRIKSWINELNDISLN